MKRKKQPISATAIRLSSYEKYSSERMDMIIKRLDDLTVEVKDLRTDMSMGKGVIAFLATMTLRLCHIENQILNTHIKRTIE